MVSFSTLSIKCTERISNEIAKSFNKTFYRDRVKEHASGILNILNIYTTTGVTCINMLKNKWTPFPNIPDYAFHIVPSILLSTLTFDKNRKRFVFAYFYDILLFLITISYLFPEHWKFSYKMVSIL